jgi:hypothetical protein
MLAARLFLLQLPSVYTIPLACSPVYLVQDCVVVSQCLLLELDFLLQLCEVCLHLTVLRLPLLHGLKLILCGE